MLNGEDQSSKLDRVIDEAIENGAVGPEAILAMVMANRSQWDIDDELTRLLKPYITQVLSMRRNSRHRIAINRSRQSRSVTADASRGITPTYAASTKVALYRASARAWLEEQVPTKNHTWKLLGDCTIPDLEFLVAARMKLAHNNREAAIRYQFLVERMRDRGVEILRHLTDDDLMGPEEIGS